MPRALGRLKPPDRRHVETHPLSAVTVTAPEPVVFGINWYEGFDTPHKGTDGKYRVTIRGGIRGGHCICAEPNDPAQRDTTAFHVFYDQGEEGACEGFGHSRALSLATRKQFDAFWLYDDARRYEDSFPEGEGSTNRSACAALKKWGDHYEDGEHCQRTPWHRGAPGVEIASYHWATQVEEVLAALGYPSSTGEFALLNSWGTAYPQRVYVSDADIQRLLDEEGECSVLVFG